MLIEIYQIYVYLINKNCNYIDVKQSGTYVGLPPSGWKAVLKRMTNQDWLVLNLEDDSTYITNIITYRSSTEICFTRWAKDGSI